VLSFYRHKNLGRLPGDAGMVVSNSLESSERIRTLRNHGQTAKYFSPRTGLEQPLWMNCKPAILPSNFAIFRIGSTHARPNAAGVHAPIDQIPGVIPPIAPEGFEHVFPPIHHSNRTPRPLQQFLSDEKSEAPSTTPRCTCNRSTYRSVHKRATSPAMPSVPRKEVLSLPMYPELRQSKCACRRNHRRILENVEFFRR